MSNERAKVEPQPRVGITDADRLFAERLIAEHMSSWPNIQKLAVKVAIVEAIYTPTFLPSGSCISNSLSGSC